MRTRAQHGEDTDCCRIESLKTAAVSLIRRQCQTMEGRVYSAKEHVVGLGPTLRESVHEEPTTPNDQLIPKFS